MIQIKKWNLKEISCLNWRSILDGKDLTEVWFKGSICLKLFQIATNWSQYFWTVDPIWSAPPKVNAILWLDPKKEVEWWICILKPKGRHGLPVNSNLCASLKAKSLSAQVRVGAGSLLVHGWMPMQVEHQESTFNESVWKRQKWWWTMTIIEDEAGEIHKKIGKEKEKKTNKNPDWNLETTQNPDSSKRDDESPGSPSIQLRLLLLPWAEDYELQLDKLRRAASPLLSSSPQVLCRFTPDFQLLGVLMARRMCITKWRLVGIGVTFWWSPRCRFSGDLHIGCILWGVLLVFVFDR